MAKRRHTAEEIVTVLRQVEVAMANGKQTAQACLWLDMEGLEHRDTVTDFNLSEGTFFDTAVIHILTSATLERLRELYPEGDFAVPRFRPNVVEKPTDGSSGFVENVWVAAPSRSVKLFV